VPFGLVPAGVNSFGDRPTLSSVHAKARNDARPVSCIYGDAGPALRHGGPCSVLAGNPIETISDQGTLRKAAGHRCESWRVAGGERNTDKSTLKLLADDQDIIGSPRSAFILVQ
jgi:hypothetical protein